MITGTAFVRQVLPPSNLPADKSNLYLVCSVVAVPETFLPGEHTFTIVGNLEPDTKTVVFKLFTDTAEDVSKLTNGSRIDQVCTNYGIWRI